MKGGSSVAFLKMQWSCSVEPDLIIFSLLPKTSANASAKAKRKEIKAPLSSLKLVHGMQTLKTDQVSKHLEENCGKKCQSGRKRCFPLCHCDLSQLFDCLVLLGFWSDLDPLKMCQSKKEFQNNKKTFQIDLAYRLQQCDSSLSLLSKPLNPWPSFTKVNLKENPPTPELQNF